MKTLAECENELRNLDLFGKLDKLYDWAKKGQIDRINFQALMGGVIDTEVEISKK